MKLNFIKNIYRKRMKLGVAYNLFDGEELLEPSLRSIRTEADYICVVYQKTSYYGNPCSSNITNILNELKDKKLIDEIYLYDKDFSKYNKRGKHIFEKEKRDIGLKLARKNHCTHYLCLDVDEFYDANQLKSAKEYILRKNIKNTACPIIEYIKGPEYQLVNYYTFSPYENYNFYVPFIMKINKFLPQKHNSKWYPTLVDPTRRLNNRKKFYLFPNHEVTMHHMSTVRKNLTVKYANSTYRDCDECVTQTNEILKSVLAWEPSEKNQLGNSEYYLFGNQLVKKVPNKFKINI